MHNISSLTEGFGCGVCAISCPKKLINIELTEDGFYAPTIPSDKLCNGCGICTSICAHINQSKHITTSVISSYAAYNKDSKIRKTAASGGIAHAITDYLIKQGHKACVVRYNSEKN